MQSFTDDEENTCEQAEMRKSPRWVPIARRKQLFTLALKMCEEVEKFEKYSERQCLLRMLETIINENR